MNAITLLSIVIRHFENYEYVNFEQFLKVVGDHLNEQKGKYKNVEFESEMTDVKCVFCPIYDKRC